MSEILEENSNSTLLRALAPDSLTEKCIVQQYRTNQQQLSLLQELYNNFGRTKLPVEWVIDIADETNGWFYGTAYHFDDVNMALHVMVPDKDNPTFDGTVRLDHRTIHLIECVDGRTDALFNHIVRESTARCKWDVEWFEDGAGDETLIEGDDGTGEAPLRGKWHATTAKYYFRMTNQLLVEDIPHEGQTQVGYVLLTADLNVKFKRCHKDRGIEDYARLVYENTVQSTPEARVEVNTYYASLEADGGEEVEQLTTAGGKETGVAGDSGVPTTSGQGSSDGVASPHMPGDSETSYAGDDAAAGTRRSKSNSNSSAARRSNRGGGGGGDDEYGASTQLGDDDPDIDNMGRNRRRSGGGSGSGNYGSSRGGRRGSTEDGGAGGGGAGDRVHPVRKLAEMSRHLKECLTEILEERERRTKTRDRMLDDFQRFVMEGNLDAGMNVLEVSEEVDAPENVRLEDEMETSVDDAWYLCQRLEKGLVRLVRGGGAGAGAAGGDGYGQVSPTRAGAASGSAATASEVEALKKQQRKMRRELEEKERELNALRASAAAAPK